jgi:MFS family permease
MATVDQSLIQQGAGATGRVSQAEQIRINIFWFANNFHWIALISVVIPAQVAVYFGSANKSANLPLVLVGGTLAAFLVNPLTGSLSDYIKSKLGRRRPFMIAGTIVNVLVLVAFAFVGQNFVRTPLSVPSITSMALLFLALEISNNFANAPWSAIIADKVPPNQRGSASGWFGIMTLLGTIAGFLFAGTLVTYGNQKIDDTFRANFAHQIFIFYLALAAVQGTLVLITVLTVKEQPSLNPPPFTWSDFLKRFRLEARRYPDFTWVLLTRVLVMTGIWAVNNFLLYYFGDILKLQNASGTLSTEFFPIVLGSSLITTFLGGVLSDRYGRKIMVYISGAMMTITCLLFIIASTLNTSAAFLAAIIAGAFFGLGYGAYTSVDWALATDVLPSAEQYGKDMGIWSAAGIIPQVLGIVLGGIIITTIRNSSIGLVGGYSVLFGVVVLLFALGTILVSRVKGAR